LRIEIPDADLEDLRERLRPTRLPAALDDPERAYGVEQGYPRELAHEWAES
jgi:hypothetical protein